MIRSATAPLFACFLMLGCDQEMRTQPRHDVYEASSFYPDGASARPLPEGTVPRGGLRDEHLHTGTVGGEYATTFPMPVTRQIIERGRQRYNIACRPCHDGVGNGNGTVVQRGFPRPPSFHTDRLRMRPVGHFFNVITNGWGAMPAHKHIVAPADRWAIISYIRALQFSQNARLEDLSEEERRLLERSP